MSGHRILRFFQIQNTLARILENINHIVGQVWRMQCRVSAQKSAILSEKWVHFPINILSEKEATSFHEELQSIESKYGSDLTGLGRNNTHQVIPFIDQLAHNPKILDVVQSILGQNILVAGTTLFIKEPEQAGFISWHQDVKYNGLKPYNWVTAWLALTEVTVENGCMYMWPGSHIDGEREHDDTYGEDNLLTRGQTVANVPEKETVAIELKPGQLSLHHP